MHANKTANVALVWTLLGYCKYMLPELTANAYTFMGNFGLTCMYIYIGNKWHVFPIVRSV